jgi:hypothetical protein
MNQLDYDLEEYLDDREYECQECGTQIDKEHSYCSRDCFNASML